MRSLQHRAKHDIGSEQMCVSVEDIPKITLHLIDRHVRSTCFAHAKARERCLNDSITPAYHATTDNNNASNSLINARATLALLKKLVYLIVYRQERIECTPLSDFGIAYICIPWITQAVPTVMALIKSEK